MRIELDRLDIDFILDKVAGMLGSKAPRPAKAARVDNNDELLTIKELAGVYGMAMKELQGLVSIGTIPSQKIGRTLKIRRSDIEAWLKNSGNMERKEGAE